MINVKDFDLSSFVPNIYKSKVKNEEGKKVDVSFCDNIITLDTETTSYYIKDGKALTFDYKKDAEFYKTTTPIPETPSQAVVTLAQVAATPQTIPEKEAIQIASVALESTSTPEGQKAIIDLTQQALLPQAAEPSKLNETVKTAIADIQTTQTKNAVESVVTLAQQAASSQPTVQIEDIAKVANTALESTSTPEGQKAVLDLTQQAVKPKAGNPYTINEATQTAIKDITK